MRKGSLNFVELHVEKVVVGLAAAFMLALVGLYLFRSPNFIAYESQQVGPDELDQAILRSAEQLQQKVARAELKGAEVPRYSQLVKEQYAGGILAPAPDSGLALPTELRRVAAFGKPAVVPGLEEAEETAGNVTVVTPLRPSPPALRTGRSLAVRTQARLEPTPSPTDVSATSAPAATEFPWVTAAVYFDLKEQQAEMTGAGYAPWAKAYVAGVDVQRQEMLASGAFSEWKDVPPSEATPEIELPEPTFDAKTGAMLNQQKINQTYQLVRRAQTTIMQPPFYDVEAGDDFEVPPLPGFDSNGEEAGDDKQKEPVERTMKKEKAERTPARQPPSQQSPRSFRNPRTGGRGGMVGPQPGPEKSTAQEPRRQTEAQQKAERGRLLSKDWQEARKLYGKKDYLGAREIANRVALSEDTKPQDKRGAEELIKKIEKKLAPPTGGRIATTAGQPGTLLADPRNPQRPVLWCHDDSVESGKTYRYRMRVRLWNRYVGQTKALRNLEDARQAVLVGEWSLPGDPITVTPSTYFFLRGARFGKKAASVDVWKWRQGEWLRENFEVEVGDAIGDVRKVRTDEYDEEGKRVSKEIDFTTGAVVLDLRFDEPMRLRMAGKEGSFSYRDAASLILVYLDPADGQVKEKVYDYDKFDPILKKLQDEEL